MKQQSNFLKLPKLYELSKDKPEGKYIKHVGAPKLSYSAISSFKEDSYRGEFFQTYFLGIRSEGNIFTTFGSACGAVLETGDEKEILSQQDKEIILKAVPRPANAVYEREIVLDRGGYVIQGFIDKEVEIEKGVLTIEDLKTGAIKTKKDFYASQDYAQTTLYAHQRALEGNRIEYSGVILLDRKGNTLDKSALTKNGDPLCLRLTGEVEYIPTPYSPERADKFLAECDEVAKEIENYFRVFNKYLK